MRKTEHPQPPRWLLSFFRWYCHPEYQEDIEGDLWERFEKRIATKGTITARRGFFMDVLRLFRPGIVRPIKGNFHFNHYTMYRSYFKIGWRNLLKHKGYFLINIGGLAAGMAVAMLIGLWVWDELSFNKHHENYERIAVVIQNLTYNGEVETTSSQSMQLGPELRSSYGTNFKHVVMSSFTKSPILSFEENVLTKTGCFMEAEAPEMLTLKMLKGTRAGLQDPNSILLSESTAYALFGDVDPMGEVVKIDNQFDVKVTGVYEDLPDNSSFNDLLFVAPLDLLAKSGNRNLGWVNNWLEVLVQLEENVDMGRVSIAIKDAKLINVDQDLAKFKPELFLHPLSKWRLYSAFENGVNTGGRIDFVWLFSIIGVFVMLLACINFMNLSTACSEKRAKEVGVRKVVGSARSQLISQFISESLLIVSMAFVLSIILVQLALPWFNEVANKKISIVWTNYGLWLFCLGIIFITALLSGSYPAFYLSAFRPGKVLKGTFRVGRYASIPRRALVIVQFTVSVTLIIGTIIVYQQIQFALNRPIGYERDGLLFVPMKTKEVKKHFNALRNDLLATGTISEVSKSECQVTNMYWSDGGFEWQGKDPNMQDILFRGAVNHEFGKTVGWKIKEGRDFSRDFSADSSAMILNEAAVSYMGLENPIGETVKAYGRNYTVIGIVENMVSQSLYSPVKQTYYVIDFFNWSEFINIKINEQASASKALEEIAMTFKKHNTATPFEYKFADEQFAYKFAAEERIGKLASVFAILAVMISCLGIFGLASYIAEQRTKEIGIRKVLGASVSHLWQLLSKDFVVLVMLSCLIAIPIAYYFLQGWLQNYEYRTHISWWIFAVAGLGVLLVTFLTVSYQTIKAASMNPVQCLKDE